MAETGSTYVELEGKFTFSINQNGLDYNKKKERQDAIEDFKICFKEFLELMDSIEHGSFMSLDYDLSKIKARVGE